MTPKLVGPGLLAPATALNQVMWNGAAVVGPAIGGIVVGQAGLSWAYGIDLATYAVAFALAVRLRPAPPDRVVGENTERGLAAVGAGLRYLRGRRVLQSTFTVDIVAMVFGMPRALFPILAMTQFDRGPEVVGWLLSAAAFGALAGALELGLGQTHTAVRARDPRGGLGVGTCDRGVRSGG